MKHTRYFLVILLIVLSAFKTGDEPMYKLIKSKRDRSLKKHEAAFNFHFEDYNGQNIQNDIHVICNGNRDWITPDEAGMVHYVVKPGACLLTFIYNEDYWTVKTDTIQAVEKYCTSIDVVFHSSVVMIGRSGRNKK
jgi:hypothetical protein